MAAKILSVLLITVFAGMVIWVAINFGWFIALLGAVVSLLAAAVESV